MSILSRLRVKVNPSSDGFEVEVSRRRKNGETRKMGKAKVSQNNVNLHLGEDDA